MHGPLLTLDEVLQRLRLSRRWMQDFLKHHEDCYLKAGNRYRFTEQHVQSLMERMACPSPSKSAAKHTGSAGLSEASVATRLQAQLKKPSRRNTARSRSEEHTSELQSLMRISYAVFCLKKKTNNNNNIQLTTQIQTK